MGHTMTKLGRQIAFNLNTKPGFASGTIKLHTDKGNFPLRLAQQGDWVRIISIRGGRGFREKFNGLGLRIGAEVQVLQNTMNGKLLLGHEDKRFYLGGGLSHKIQVAVIEGGKK